MARWKRNTKAEEEPTLFNEITKQGKACQAKNKRANHALADVFVVKMTQFMRKNGLHFSVIHTVKQCIKEYNSLVFAKAGEIGVTVRGSFRAIHNKDAVIFKAGSLQKAVYSIVEGVVF